MRHTQPPFWIAALTGLGLLAFTAPLHATVPPLYWGGINAGVAVRQGYHIEWQRTAEDGAPGQVIISWSDTRYGMRDLFAQKIDASQPSNPAVWSMTGTSHGNVDALIVNDDVIRQEDPVLITDAAGGAIVSWIDFRVDPRGDIYVNRLMDGDAGTGTVGWGTNGVVMCTACANGSENMSKSQCVDGAGGSWVAWTDHRGSTWDIYISHVLGNGSIPATFLPDGLPIVTEVGDQEALTMEEDGAGGAFIAWVDKRDAADDNIYIQHVLANGTLAGGENGVPVVQLAGSQHSVKVTTDGGTGCFVSWVDLRADNAGDVYLQHFSANLTPTFAANGLAIASQSGNAEKNPRLSYAGDGATLLMWEDNRNDPGNTQADIYLQKVSTANTQMWGAGGVPVTLASGDQQQARVLGDGSGGAFLVWQDNRNETFSAIYAQRMNASGQRQWQPDGNAVVERADISTDAIAPALRSDNQGGLFVVWGDLSRGSLGIFSQHLTAAGTRSFDTTGHDSAWGISGSCARVRNLAVDNGALVFWIDPRNAGGPHVYMQHLDRQTGAQLLPNTGVPVALELEGGQISYQIAPDGAGGAYVLLEVGSESAQRAWLTRVDGNGQPLWDAPRPVTPAFDSGSGLEYQERTRLMVAGNQIVVAWSGVDTDYSDFFAEVGVQAFDTAGNVLWGDAGLRITSSPTIHEKLSDIAPGPAGGVYLLWDSGNWQDTNVMMQLVNAQGQIVLAAGGLPFANGEGKQEQAIAVAGDHGNLLGLWHDYTAEFSDSDLIIRSMSAAGTPEWTTNVDMRPQSQKTPVLASDLQGGAYIAYTDFSNGANDDVYTQRVLADGSLAWSGSETEVLTGVGTQEDVAAAVVPRGGWNGLVLALANEESTDTTGYKDLWARDVKVSPAGAQDTTYYSGSVFHFFHTQREPWLSYDLADGTYLSWVDMRASGKEDLKDVYTLRLADHDTGVEPNPVVARGFQLAQNTPNPFNPSTEIAFQILQAGPVRLEVFDLQGRLARTLEDGVLGAGTYLRHFDGRDSAGRPLASGVYFYRLAAGGHEQTRRMLMVK